MQHHLHESSTVEQQLHITTGDYCCFYNNISTLVVVVVVVVVVMLQGWARDVKARERDAHLPKLRRDRDVGFTS